MIEEGFRLDLYDPEAPAKFMTMAELMALPSGEADLLREEIHDLQAFLYDLAFGPGWTDAAPTCCCGKRMLVARHPYHNSGTTRITFACTEAIPYTKTGHQWAVTTSPEHYLETDGGKCCGSLVETLEVCG